jgi:hypothetical protein
MVKMGCTHSSFIQKPPYGGGGGASPTTAPSYMTRGGPRSDKVGGNYQPMEKEFIPRGGRGASAGRSLPRASTIHLWPSA